MSSYESELKNAGQGVYLLNDMPCWNIHPAVGFVHLLFIGINWTVTLTVIEHV